MMDYNEIYEESMAAVVQAAAYVVNTSRTQRPSVEGVDERAVVILDKYDLIPKALTLRLERALQDFLDLNRPPEA